ncbi:MAG: RDD family protein [Alphaproteobacteria bacterium]|nr:RDD family protein [Alphaproteobacteria bacterium]
MKSSTIPNTSLETVEWRYAGFWMRFFAITLDNMILFFIVGTICLFFGIVSGIGQVVVWPIAAGITEWSAEYSSGSSMAFKMTLISWLYFSLMESSRWQATFGKRLFGIYVTTEEGGRISFKRATARYFSKYISAFIFFVGFIMAAFTAKRQALHDIIAETLVLRR